MRKFITRRKWMWYLLIMISIVGVLALKNFINGLKLKLKNHFDDTDEFQTASPRKKLFCIILTKKTNLYNMTNLIYRAWARKCDNFKFITTLPKQLILNNSRIKKGIEVKINNNRVNLLQPPGYVNDKYEKLTDKVYLTFKYLYENNYNDYEWYLKADDDTFIFVNNLRKFLSNKNPAMPITFGYDFKEEVLEGYHSGGAGYVLSRNSFNRIGSVLSSNYSFCPNTGTEDVDIARCLRKLGVHPSKSIDDLNRERFHLFNISMHYYGTYETLFSWVLKYSKNGLRKVKNFI